MPTTEDRKRVLPQNVIFSEFLIGMSRKCDFGILGASQATKL